MHFLRSLFDRILPTACIVCARHQTAMLCETCFLFLQKHTLFNRSTCMQCGIEHWRPEPAGSRCQSCIDRPPAFDQSHCLDRYDGVLQNAIHELKYQKRLAFADGLAHTWNRIAMPRLANDSADVLIPVPLSHIKLHHRGFNQAWELAKRITLSGATKPLAHAVQRHHDDHAQAHSSRMSRQHSLRNAFFLHPNSVSAIRNKSVIVFDDVMTTGSTLHEIAYLLKDNGARQVSNWVILRTSTPQPLHRHNEA